MAHIVVFVFSVTLTLTFDLCSIVCHTHCVWYTGISMRSFIRIHPVILGDMPRTRTYARLCCTYACLHACTHARTHWYACTLALIRTHACHACTARSHWGTHICSHTDTHTTHITLILISKVCFFEHMAMFILVCMNRVHFIWVFCIPAVCLFKFWVILCSCLLFWGRVFGPLAGWVRGGGCPFLGL